MGAEGVGEGVSDRQHCSTRGGREKRCGVQGRQTFLLASSSFNVISSHFLRRFSFSA